MNKDKAQEYKEEFLKHCREACIDLDDHGEQLVDNIGLEGIYLLGRKAAEGEIDELKNAKNFLLKASGCETCYCDQLENEIQDRDQRVRDLEELARVLLEKRVVQDAYESQIKERDELIKEAIGYVKECKDAWRNYPSPRAFELIRAIDLWLEKATAILNAEKGE